MSSERAESPGALPHVICTPWELRHTLVGTPPSDGDTAIGDTHIVPAAGPACFSVLHGRPGGRRQYRQHTQQRSGRRPVREPRSCGELGSGRRPAAWLRAEEPTHGAHGLRLCPFVTFFSPVPDEHRSDWRPSSREGPSVQASAVPAAQEKCCILAKNETAL